MPMPPTFASRCPLHHLARADNGFCVTHQEASSATMSLAFLFKKTWHPSTLQNSERVWIAEQKDAAEKKRIEELTKQVREEQQVRELEEMQVCVCVSAMQLCARSCW